MCGYESAVKKEFNLKRHFERHRKDVDKLSVSEKHQKLSSYRENLSCSSNSEMDKHNRADDAVRVSFVIAEILARRGKSFTDGLIVKECLVKAAEVIAPESVSTFQDISLSPNTVSDRMEDIAKDLEKQLRQKCAKLTHFSIAMDESTDIRDTAQLAIFIRGVDEDLCVVEELLDLVPLKNTTKGADLLQALVDVVDKFNLTWDQFVALTTDGAPAMKGDKKERLVARLRQYLRGLGIPSDFLHFHCIVHQEALCAASLPDNRVMSVVVKAVNYIRAQGLNRRQFQALLETIESDYEDVPYHNKTRWLSRANVLKAFFDLREIISKFMTEKGKPIPQLEDPLWVQELAFLVDMTHHLSVLNKKLQGKGHMISDLYPKVLRVLKCALIYLQVSLVLVS